MDQPAGADLVGHPDDVTVFSAVIDDTAPKSQPSAAEGNNVPLGE
jgi:hypothetical protein